RGWQEGNDPMKKFVGFAFLLLWASNLQAQVPFYAGKTIKIVVGLPAGDAYDLYARILADHMGKYIPGNPTFIVQNMPGASTMIAANYVYNVAKPDGLTFGSTLPSLYFDQLVGRKEVQFDWTKFVWLGSFERSNNLLYMRADSPYKTIHDVTRASDPPKCGSTGSGSPSYYMIRLLNEAIGTKFNVVTGYQGGQEIDLAVEEGRSTVPRFYGHDLLCPRTVPYLAKNRVCSGADPDRQEARREITRCADGIRTNGGI
ncbi:MAG TPA: tripartite tricarboxylate transporter substrate-binding protein, partial [Candidatus Binatia bacterium]|nr:tripartite tricarboxylate transporter substrate-binding protein [Candidatus Binatia bacterium]